MKTVAVIGSGAREHAIAGKIAKDAAKENLPLNLLLVPGNDGMYASLKKAFTQLSIERVSASLAKGREEYERLAKELLEKKTDFAVIGPDDPLAMGIVDVFKAKGISTFGPTSGAAQIEASKAFSKQVMNAAGVPTAKFEVFTDIEAGKTFLKKADWSQHGWVIKADGLALGKGVVVCKTLEQSLEAIEQLHKISGKTLIEEELTGEELTWMAICDGETAALLDPARDYKRVGTGNVGGNTGGMGAVSPLPGISQTLRERVREKVFMPVMAEMKKRGVPFQGILYAGLMWNKTRDTFWVIEFNARFGDPEAEVVLPRWEGSFLNWCVAAAKGELAKLSKDVPFVDSTFVYIVGAARGYPDQPEKGALIKNAEELLGGPYFCAGIEGNEVTGFKVSGGRVLGALASAPGISAASVVQARETARQRIEKIQFDGKHFRTDIAEEWGN